MHLCPLALSSLSFSLILPVSNTFPFDRQFLPNSPPVNVCQSISYVSFSCYPLFFSTHKTSSFSPSLWVNVPRPLTPSFFICKKINSMFCISFLLHFFCFHFILLTLGVLLCVLVAPLLFQLFFIDMQLPHSFDPLHHFEFSLSSIYFRLHHLTLSHRPFIKLVLMHQVKIFSSLPVI